MKWKEGGAEVVGEKIKLRKKLGRNFIDKRIDAAFSLHAFHLWSRWGNARQEFQTIRTEKFIFPRSVRDDEIYMEVSQIPFGAGQRLEGSLSLYEPFQLSFPEIECSIAEL